MRIVAVVGGQKPDFLAELTDLLKSHGFGFAFVAEWKDGEPFPVPAAPADPGPPAGPNPMQVRNERRNRGGLGPSA